MKGITWVYIVIIVLVLAAFWWLMSNRSETLSEPSDQELEEILQQPVDENVTIPDA